MYLMTDSPITKPSCYLPLSARLPALPSLPSLPSLHSLPSLPSLPLSRFRPLSCGRSSTRDTSLPLVDLSDLPEHEPEPVRTREDPLTSPIRSTDLARPASPDVLYTAAGAAGGGPKVGATIR